MSPAKHASQSTRFHIIADSLIANACDQSHRVESLPLGTVTYLRQFFK